MRVLYVLLSAACLSCAGCLSPASVHPEQYPVMPNKQADRVAFAQPDPLEGQWHSLRVVPATKANISTCDKINPLWWFGNADEPTPPAWYRPEAKLRTFRWHLRNPIHNLSHYVVGVSDKETVRSGKHIKTVANPNGGWNFCVTKYKHWRLPFVDYHRGKFEFYLGWRVGGNFGIKCNWHDEHAPPDQPAGATNENINLPARNATSAVEKEE